MSIKMVCLLLFYTNEQELWCTDCKITTIACLCAYSQNLTAAELDKKIIMLKQAMARKLQ